MIKKLKRKLNFDVSTFCNHKCTFCSNPDTRTIKSQVSYEQYIKVMDNVMQYIETNEIGLSAKGEVLINKDLASIIKVTKEKYSIPYIYISSNGALATKEKLSELLEAGLDSTKFSINAVTKEEYEKVHLSDDFELVIKNLKILIDLKRTKYPNHKIFLSSVIDMKKEQLIDHFKSILGEEDFALLNGIDIFTLDYTPKFEETKSTKKITKSCPIPFNEIYINSDCTLGLCCKDYFDEISFGSLLENDFLELYNSKECEDIRQMHIKKEFPDNHLCKNCLLYEG
ncbi:MAG: radical SAM protein [Campylobacterota bacterium]|nr:radical SAM protein [Campylobacterota bacterium]